MLVLVLLVLGLLVHGHLHRLLLHHLVVPAIAPSVVGVPAKVCTAHARNSLAQRRCALAWARARLLRDVCEAHGQRACGAAGKVQEEVLQRAEC